MGRLIDEDSLKFTNFEIVMCDGDFKKAFKLICEKLDNAPTVNVEPVVHAHWEEVYGYVTPGGDPVWACSNCGKGEHIFGAEAMTYNRDISDNHQWVACPNCGAKMDGEK